NKVGCIVRRKQAHPDSALTHRKRQDEFRLISRAERKKEIILLGIRQLLKCFDALLGRHRVPQVERALQLVCYSVSHATFILSFAHALLSRYDPCNVQTLFKRSSR